MLSAAGDLIAARSNRAMARSAPCIDAEPFKRRINPMPGDRAPRSFLTPRPMGASAMLGRPRPSAMRDAPLVPCPAPVVLESEMAATAGSSRRTPPLRLMLAMPGPSALPPPICCLEQSLLPLLPNLLLVLFCCAPFFCSNAPQGATPCHHKCRGPGPYPCLRRKGRLHGWVGFEHVPKSSR